MKNMRHYSILLVVLYFVNFTQPCPYALEASINCINSPALSRLLCVEMVHSEPPRRWWLHDAGPGQQGLRVRVQAAGAVWPHGAQPLLILQLSAHVQNKGTMMQHSAHILALIHSMSQVGIGSPYWPGYSRLFLKEDPEGGWRSDMYYARKFLLFQPLNIINC